MCLFRKARTFTSTILENLGTVISLMMFGAGEHYRSYNAEERPAKRPSSL